MLPLEAPIIAIEYQTGELIPELDILRNSIVDVRCTAADGRQFIVEMQLYWYDGFKKRVLFNASKAYVMQLDAAEKFKSLQPVYSLNFINGTFEKTPEMEHEYYHHYKIVNVKDTEKQIEGLEFVFLELPKFKPENRAEKKLHELWLRFLTEINESTREIPKELLENEHIREAVGYVERGAYTKSQLMTYDKLKIDWLTARSMLDEAEELGLEMGIEKGIERGIEQGLEIGIERGIVKGMEKGMEQGLEIGIEKGEYKKACVVALKMLEKGMSIEDIGDITSLTKRQIEELQKN